MALFFLLVCCATDAIDLPALLTTMAMLRNGQAVDIPVYDFNLHQRAAHTQRVEPADVIIVEGACVRA
jgi:uridine kinase